MISPSTVSRYLVSILAVVLVSLCPVSSSPTLTTTSDVQLLATPDTYFAGLTNTLSVTCSHHIHNGSDFSNVVSLILSKNSASQQNTFTELAALTSQSRETVDVKNYSLTADVTGRLPQAGEAFITMKFHHPTAEVSGEYKCQAFGIDHDGHPRISTDEIEVVAEDSITTAVLIQKIKEMDLAQDKLKTELNQLKANVSNRLNNTRTAIMDASATYNGHTYFLSKPMVRNIAISDSLCRQFGGYLAEIDTKQELDFVYNFAIRQNKGYKVVVGATDQGHNHVWKYIYSGKTVTYTNWWDHENNDGDCMELWESHFGMCDEPCVSADIRRFVCEMPW